MAAVTKGNTGTYENFSFEFPYCCVCLKRKKTTRTAQKLAIKNRCSGFVPGHLQTSTNLLRDYMSYNAILQVILLGAHLQPNKNKTKVLLSFNRSVFFLCGGWENFRSLSLHVSPLSLFGYNNNTKIRRKITKNKRNSFCVYSTLAANLHGWIDANLFTVFVFS